ncbi:MAG: TetR/AcrR family transcriptional regulator [Phenylobacterium sp.]|nr:MAG: TetR/AcrR family transcriptional regulator [Phenylobacterium sp.]
MPNGLAKGALRRYVAGMGRRTVSEDDLARPPEAPPLRARFEALLDEAARQFNDHGVLLTSLPDIADGLELSRAALYYYVDDREDLVFKVYRRSVEVLARNLEASAQTGQTVLESINAFVAATLSPAAPEIAALNEIGLLREPERATILALHAGVIARLGGILEGGIRAGEIRRCDTDVAARCIVSMVYWLPLAHRWRAWQALDRQRLIALICDLVANGVAADRREIRSPVRMDLTPLRAGETVALDPAGLREARRETILRTASRLFDAKGIDTTSLEEIAAALGTSTRTLYRNVGDKPSIVKACYERAFRIALYISDAAGLLDLSAAEALDAQQRAHAIAQQDPAIAPLRHGSGLDALAPDARAVVDDMADQLTVAARTRIHQAQAENEIRRLDAEEFLVLATGPSAWLAKPFIETTPQRRIEIADAVADFVRLGLTALDAGSERGR